MAGCIDLTNKPLMVKDTALLLCDLQEAYQDLIGSTIFNKLILNVNKLFAFARKTNLPIFMTEKSGMGYTCKAVYPCYQKYYTFMEFKSTGQLSMLTTRLRHEISQREIKSVILCGFEANEAVKLTALHLRSLNINVIIVSDACGGIIQEKTDEAFWELTKQGSILMRTTAVVETVLYENSNLELDVELCNNAKSPLDNFLERKEKEKRFEVEKVGEKMALEGKEELRNLDSGDRKKLASKNLDSDVGENLDSDLGENLDSDIHEHLDSDIHEHLDSDLAGPCREFGFGA